MNFAFYIARRYLFTLSKSSAINFITGITSASIIVGAATMFVVISAFSGLKEFSLSFTNNFDPDLKVTSIVGKTITMTPEQEQALKKMPGIAYYSRIIEERVLFSYDGKQQVTYLKGIDSNYIYVNPIKEKVAGQWVVPNSNQVVMGFGTSDKLSIQLYNFEIPLEVFIPKPGKGQIDDPDKAFTKASLRPTGFYSINEDYDSKYVFADLDLVQHLMEFQPNTISGLEIKLKPNVSEDSVMSELQKLFGPKTDVKTRAQLNDALYRMLNTEFIAVYLILTLIIIMTLFTLIGAIIMMILDKKSNLKTLASLGAEIRELRRIFLLQGTLLTLTGCFIGLFIGITLVVLQLKFQMFMITDNLAYPVAFSIQNIFIVLATIMILGFIASKIASSRISKKLLE